MRFQCCLYFDSGAHPARSSVTFKGGKAFVPARVKRASRLLCNAHAIQTRDAVSAQRLPRSAATDHRSYSTQSARSRKTAISVGWLLVITALTAQKRASTAERSLITELQYITKLPPKAIYNLLSRCTKPLASTLTRKSLLISLTFVTPASAMQSLISSASKRKQSSTPA